MRIGGDDNFLQIESSSTDGSYSSLRIEAVASASGRKFTCFHDRAMIERSHDTFAQLAEFESLRVNRFEIPLSEGGWRRLSRDLRGYITVKYRVAGGKASAAMEGELIVAGEFANQFCRDFETLLRQ